MNAGGLKEYNSSVKMSYRSKQLSKQTLLEMRKTLLDKCEEIIDYTVFPF